MCRVSSARRGSWGEGSALCPLHLYKTILEEGFNPGNPKILVLDTEEFDRWFKSAKLTLDSAKHDLNGGFYNWACFKAQQSTELAVKAYFYGLGQPKSGHTVSYLLTMLSASQELVDKAKYLDKLYIPTRYPDVWQSETPQYYYTRREAEEAIIYAEEIINYVEGLWRILLQKEKERGGK